MQINIATGPWLPVPAIQGGAVNRRWQGVAEVFAARGHQVTILCRSYPGQPQFEKINGVSYIRRGGFPQSTNIYLDLIKDLVYALTTFPVLPLADILVINDFWLPVFATLRPKVGKIVINSARFPKGQYWLYAKVHCFAAVSHAIEEAIAQEYPDGISRIKVISNPIDTITFHPPIAPRPSREDKTILYVGRVHPEKGIHLLLDAFAILSQQFPRIRLRIIGPIKENQGGGGESYFRKLKTKAENLPVEFSQPIFEPTKLADAYRQADLFCYPSLAEKGESFGVAPLEAMASGLVPVVSNLDCFRDFIEEGITGYFFDHRSDDAANNLSATLSSAIINWETTSTMAEKAAHKAQEFSYDKIADSYLADFEELLTKE
ncbi:MAG: glycosyltransferase family 4 protein [Nostocaceae cyanobacterium]|nr:glycosyltransferase family 4 protein [Nostocaceae cyanobacterium]